MHLFPPFPSPFFCDVLRFRLILESFTVLCTDDGSCMVTETSVFESDILTSETELLLPEKNVVLANY